MSGGHLGAAAPPRQFGVDVLLEQPERGPRLGPITCEDRRVMVVLEHELPRGGAVESGSRVHSGPPHPLQYHEDMHKA